MRRISLRKTYLALGLVAGSLLSACDKGGIVEEEGANTTASEPADTPQPRADAPSRSESGANSPSSNVSPSPAATAADAPAAVTATPATGVAPAQTSASAEVLPQRGTPEWDAMVQRKNAEAAASEAAEKQK